MLTAADDRGHELGDDPRAQESLLWNVVVPDENVFAIAYLAHRAAASSTVMLAFADGPAPLVAELAQDIPFAGDDLTDFTAGELQATQGGPLRTATVAYRGPQIELDYRFTGVHEAFDFALNRDGCVPAAATNRFEQSGRIEGRIRVEDRTVPFDAMGHCDHSWGVRDYPAILHYKWISAQAGPDLSFHAMHTWWRGRECHNGYVWRDGTLSAIVDMRTEAEFDQALLQRAGTVTLRDEAGRITRARYERFAGGFVPLGPVVLAEAGCRYEIEGQPGAGVTEYGWQAGYLEHLRANP